MKTLEEICFQELQERVKKMKSNEEEDKKVERHLCEKCLKEIDPKDDVTVIDFPLLKDPTKPVKFLEIHLHAKCLLELVKSGELYSFITAVKKIRKME